MAPMPATCVPAALPARQRPPQVPSCRCCRGLLPLATSSASPGAGDAPPPLPPVARLSERVTRVLGRNASPFTLTGTNLYLVGTGRRRILVDAGEGKPGVLDDLLGAMRSEGCEGLEQIVITHWHHDHLMGVPELLSHFGPLPVRKYQPPEGTASGERGPQKDMGYFFDPNDVLRDVQVVGLSDGEVLHCEGAALQVLFTPGHANDHVSLWLKEERGLFTGDNVLGWGTGVFQDLQLYMRSLRKMRDMEPELLYPAHGPVVERGRAGAWMQMYISHREERIEQVAASLRAGPTYGLTLEAVAKAVYSDQPHVLRNPVLFAGACNNSKLVLEYLEKEGLCVQEGGNYRFVSAKL